MTKYFIAKGNDKIGPFSLDELKDKNITSETFIWHEGLSDWQKASSISELSGIISLAPPPVQNQQVYNPEVEMNKKNKTDIFVFIAILYWFSTMSLDRFITIFFEYSSLIYLHIAINIIFAAVPIIIAISIKSITLRIIAIILSIIMAISIIFSNIFQLFNYPNY